MSILLANEVATPSILLVLAGCTVVAMLILWNVGYFKPRDAQSLQRLFSLERVGPIVTNAAIGFALSFGTAMAAGLALGIYDPAAIKNAKEIGLPPTILIALSFVMPLASLVSMGIGLKTIVPDGPSQLGLAGTTKIRAILTAAGVLLAVLPLIMLVSNVAEMLYQYFNWTHEDAHELLRSMKSVDSVGKKVLAVLAAVVLAPVSEELLFRGHLQTAIRRMLLRSTKNRLPAMADRVGDVAPPPLPYEPVAVLGPPAKADARTFLASLAAVVISSAFFAYIHAGWSRPPIFVLSLFLGLAYERRGNLWTPIFLHALFNGSMITLYLFMQPVAT